MWIKRVDGSYLNTTTNATLHVYAVGGAFGISANSSGAPVAHGFATTDDAQEALDNFMAEQGYESIPNADSV